jgi:addiction module RelB/DinJ family antitoxin
MSNTNTKSQVIIPVDKNLKSEVKAILAELGLNQSQVVISLFKQIVRTGKVPLSFDLNDGNDTAFIKSDQKTYDILMKYQQLETIQKEDKVFADIKDFENVRNKI